MSDLIQWPTAKYWTAQWNPIIGCRPCSPACENCYAAAWAKRFGQSFEPHATKQRPPRKGVVFCGSMTDLFGEWRSSTEMVVDVSIPCKTQGAQYLWLTKRAHNLATTICHLANCHPYPELWYDNHYFGFTAENKEWYEKRLEVFDTMPTWANKWVSCEPLLGPIDELYLAVHTMGLKWLVVGCESGPNRRPCKIEWVESIVEQCRAANVPVFVKQLDIGGKCVTDIDKFPAHLRIRQVPWAKETK